jgi:hypothetical protein
MAKQASAAKPRGRLVSHLSNDFFVALGKVTAEFASLEHSLKVLAGLLLHKTDQELGQIVTAQLSFRSLLDLVGSLALYRVSDDPAHGEIDELLSRAERVEKRRNRVTHSDWGPATVREPDREKRARFKTTARRAKGLSFELENMSPTDVEDIAIEASALAGDVLEMWVQLTQEGRWG